ncbi:MAG: HAD-IIB family hydrolase [Magnetococcales bacterium]|nr:HAD-IIB family hydrolase [Magnetococcales bacterium]
MEEQLKDSTDETLLYIVLISVHGLIRGKNPELGSDADTGGQTTYVLELARALGRHPAVGRVDLFTRQVFDSRVSDDYAVPLEPLGEKAFLVRIPCGPRRYLRKETLWPHLDHFTDNALPHFRAIGQVPDVIHSHYADAGLVATRLARMLGILHVHTGHSLGRVKRERLLAKGVSEENVESRYAMSRRIEAEEVALGSADFVVASTSQEVEDQYRPYENYHPKRMVVMPPGVDLSRFRPLEAREKSLPPIAESVDRFLHEPKKPMILALSRADERKNIATLVRAYGENPALRELANLVIVAGNRDDISSMEKGAREVLTTLLMDIDRYDLHGSIAYPKHHTPDDVPDLYRLVASRRGVFINPALTEPFGLTLIEAAASGVPIVATADGGPRDIIHHCRNGVLVDPLDAEAMGEALLDALSNTDRWRRWSKNGVTGTHRHYSWPGHVERYLEKVERHLVQRRRRWSQQIQNGVSAPLGGRGEGEVLPRQRSRLPMVDRLLICDIDNTLIGDEKGLCVLQDHLLEAGDTVGFGIATGRNLKSAMKALKEWGIPLPDILITSVGSVIHYRQGVTEEEGWARHLDHRWDPEGLRSAMTEIPGLRLQPKEDQGTYKVSYFVDPDRVPSMAEINRHLRKQDLHTRMIYSHGEFLDLLPIRGSKGLAVSYLALKWGIPLDQVAVAGDSGNDEEMLRGSTLGIVVGNSSPELDILRGHSRIYFAEEPCAWGIMEGIRHYNFFGEIQPDRQESPSDRGEE